MKNAGGGALGLAQTKIRYERGRDWLCVSHDQQADSRRLSIAVDATRLAVGNYVAWLQVMCPGAVNSPQSVRVELEATDTQPQALVTIDNRDPGFFATPFFWVGHRFSRCPADRRGFGGFYLSNGRRARNGEFVRFTPDLQAGRYDVSLVAETPFGEDVEFNVRVRHADGVETIRVCPQHSRQIGSFVFDEDADGFVEILAAGSMGLVLADAVNFRRRE